MNRWHRGLSAFDFIPLCALICMPFAASAQAITGTVQSSGRPIAGASVRLLELDRITRTNERGQFVFAYVTMGSYRVLVGAPGYAAATQTVAVKSANASAAFELRPSAMPLREVVISASPVAQASSEQFQSAESRGLADFMSASGASFAEKISDIPGVAVRQNGSAPARPILRGLGDNEVLVLENGLRMGDIAIYDPAHATPIAAQSIAQVDVVRGPATILYGPSTIGGLVNLLTNVVPTISDRHVSGSAVFEGNSVNGQAAGHVRTQFSDGNQAFQLSGGIVRSQDTRIPSGTYVDPATETEFQLDRLPQTFDRSSEFGAGYAWQGKAGKIGFGAKHFEMDYGIPGVPPNPDWETVPPTTSRIIQRRNTLEMHGLTQVDGAFVRQLRLDANYNDYNHSEFPTQQDASGVSSPQANHFHKRQFNAVVQARQQSQGNLQGTLGVWANIEDLTIDGDQPLGPNSLTTGLAGYAYEEYTMSRDTRLQGGLRFDYNRIATRPYAASADASFRTIDESRLSNAITASFGAVHQFARGLSGSFSVARSFRAPTVQELFANGLDAASGTYSIGTASLGPESGLGADASLRGDFERVAFEVSPYVNFIDHYIYGFLRGDTIENFPVRKFAATQARLYGVEVAATVQATDHLAVRASTDYVNAQDTKRDMPLPFTPPLRFLLRGTYEEGMFTGMLEWRGAASQTRLGDGDTPTSGYALLNLGAGVRIVQAAVVHRISLHVDNVFNRIYRDHLSVIKDFLPQPARGVRLNYELLY